MPVPIAVAIRHQIVERHQGGTSFGAIAKDFEMSYDRVRNVWRLDKKAGRLTPNYANCGQIGPKVSKRVYRAALFLKQRHPTGGAPLIRQLIREKWQDEPVSTARSIQRWFKKAGLNQARKKPVGEARSGRAQVAHQVWELDSREEIELASGQKGVWLLASDEASGAILNGAVFPHRQSRPTEC
jgi:hypothetical protein